MERDDAVEGDGLDVAELGRAVKRLNTGSGDGTGGNGARAGGRMGASAYAEVNAMLRMLHFERVRRVRERAGVDMDAAHEGGVEDG